MRNRLRQFLARMQWAVEVYRLRFAGACLAGLVALWVVASGVLWWAERARGALSPDDRFYRFSDCLWCSTVYLLSGLEEFGPNTALGRACAVVVMVAGVAMLGLLGTTLLAAVVESVTLRSRVKRKPSVCRLRDHVVICNWSRKGDAIVRELHAEQFGMRTRRPIVIVAPEADEIRITDRRAYRGVWAVRGDPVRREALSEADVEDAHSVVVVAAGDHAASAKGADAQTILVALALQTMSHTVRPCAEVLDDANRTHFERTSVGELISVRDVAARLIAHAAHSHYLTDFFLELLTVSSDTSEVYILDVPDALAGRSFVEVQRLFQASSVSDVVPIGIQRQTAGGRGGKPICDRFGRPISRPLLTVNPRRTRPGARERSADARPTRDEPLKPGDKLVVIARAEPDLGKLPAASPEQPTSGTAAADGRQPERETADGR